MSNGNDRHPIDAEDTDWGKEKDAQHMEHLARFDRLEGKIDDHWKAHLEQHTSIFTSIGKLGERMSASEEDRKLLRQELGVNTSLTKEIKNTADVINTRTEWILSFASNYKGIKKFLIWITPIASAALAFYLAWTVKK